MATVSDEVQQKVSGLMRDLLAERFKDEFVFDPIIVQSEYDEDDEQYLHIYIVFDGDLKKLDPDRTIGLSGCIREDVDKLGFQQLPSTSFIATSEWKKLFERKYRETGRVR